MNIRKIATKPDHKTILYKINFDENKSELYEVNQEGIFQVVNVIHKKRITNEELIKFIKDYESSK